MNGLPIITVDELNAELERLYAEQPPAKLSERERKRLRHQLKERHSIDWRSIVDDMAREKDEELKLAADARRKR